MEPTFHVKFNCKKSTEFIFKRGYLEWDKVTKPALSFSYYENIILMKCDFTKK